MNPPTDSLHKFMAIGGLLIIFYSNSFYFHEKNEIIINSIKLESRADLLESDSEYLKAYLKDIKSSKKESINNQIISDIELKTRELERETSEARVEGRMLANSVGQIKYFDYVILLINIFGFASSFFGFKKWWILENKKSKIKKK